MKGSSAAHTHCRGLGSAQGQRACRKEGRGEIISSALPHTIVLNLKQSGLLCSSVQSDTSYLSFHPIRHQLPFFSSNQILAAAFFFSIHAFRVSPTPHWLLCCAWYKRMNTSQIFCMGLVDSSSLCWEEGLSLPFHRSGI